MITNEPRSVPLTRAPVISPLLHFFTLKKQNFFSFPLKNTYLQSSEKTGTINPHNIIIIIIKYNYYRTNTITIVKCNKQRHCNDKPEGIVLQPDDLVLDLNKRTTK